MATACPAKVPRSRLRPAWFFWPVRWMALLEDRRALWKRGGPQRVLRALRGAGGRAAYTLRGGT